MSSIAFAYLGKPGAMRQLPIPRRGFESPLSRSDTVHTLLSGGSTVTRNLNPKRAFTLPYDVSEAEADVILGFYQGLYGLGPWCFVDPTATNMLTLDASSCGLRTQADDGWVQSTGTITRTTTGGPTGVDSGVLTWGTLLASATLQPGVTANVAPVTSAPVYLPTEPVTASLWVKASSSTTASLQLTGYDAAGVVLVTSVATSMSVTTAWQRFTVAPAAGLGALASAVFVLPRVVLGGTVPTTVSIAGGQLEYADAVTTWGAGFGCPRVLVTDAPGRSINAPGYRAHTLSLAEV